MKKQKPTFLEQYNKITKAYYKNELNPMDSCACFIGNLLNNSSDWNTFYGCKRTGEMDEEYKFYTGDEIKLLEHNFLNIIESSYCKSTKIVKLGEKLRYMSNPPEEVLFKAMENTLEMLKQIHISKGEIVPDYSFTKRKLKLV